MNDQAPESTLPTPPPEAPPTVVQMGVSAWLEQALRLMLLIALLAMMGVFAIIVAPGPSRVDETVLIPHGTATQNIANQLGDAGFIYSPTLFRLAAKVIAYDSLRAGEYQITPRISIAEAVLMMHKGRSVLHKFTVAEGLTSAEIVGMLRDSPALTGDIAEIPPEGSLLPETYAYTYGDSRADLIARMTKDMKNLRDSLWAARDPSIMLASPDQAMVMASVVEKETGKATERPRIAGVFYNRMRHHMRLQSDPTVIYGITLTHGPMDHALTHDDLAFASPYNTYANDGLPPAPICNPGRAALEAALHPAIHDDLYFVADGTGGHVFARTLAEHNQNVAQWNRLKEQKPYTSERMK